MIDETIITGKVSDMNVLLNNLNTISQQATMIKNALKGIILVDGELPLDRLTGIQITEEWRQKIYDDCIKKADTLKIFITDSEPAP